MQGQKSIHMVDAEGSLADCCFRLGSIFMPPASHRHRVKVCLAYRCRSWFASFVHTFSAIVDSSTKPHSHRMKVDAKGLDVANCYGAPSGPMTCVSSCVQGIGNCQVGASSWMVWVGYNHGNCHLTVVIETGAYLSPQVHATLLLLRYITATSLLNNLHMYTNL